MMTEKKTLLETLRSRPVGPTQPSRGGDPEKDFSSQIEVSGSTASITVRDEPGAVNEGTAKEFLEKEGLSPDEWQVTGFRRSEWTSPTGDTLESVRFSFSRVAPESSSSLVLPDLDDLHKSVKKAKTKKPKKVESNGLTVVGMLADPQVGKHDLNGGTERILQNLEESLDKWVDYIKTHKPEEIILLDLGDAIENFECVASEERTNDLSLTEQLRVWRRVFWSWIYTAASLAPKVKVASVPSNHCQVRRGKNRMGHPDDDYGIEILTQVADMASVYPEKYGHVEFYTPQGYSESLTITSVSGKVVGAAHGHQVSKPDALEGWLARQALGENPVSYADLVAFGHFHHLTVREYGRNKTYFIAPSSDPGSYWYSNNSGNYSKNGVLTLTLDESGWDNMKIC